MNEKIANAVEFVKKHLQYFIYGLIGILTIVLVSVLLSWAIAGDKEAIVEVRSATLVSDGELPTEFLVNQKFAAEGASLDIGGELIPLDKCNINEGFSSSAGEKRVEITYQYTDFISYKAEHVVDVLFVRSVAIESYPRVVTVDESGAHTDGEFKMYATLAMRPATDAFGAVEETETGYKILLDESMYQTECAEDTTLKNFYTLSFFCGNIKTQFSFYNAAGKSFIVGSTKDVVSFTEKTAAQVQSDDEESDGEEQQQKSALTLIVTDRADSYQDDCTGTTLGTYVYSKPDGTETEYGFDFELTDTEELLRSADIEEGYEDGNYTVDVDGKRFTAAADVWQSAVVNGNIVDDHGYKLVVNDRDLRKLEFTQLTVQQVLTATTTHMFGSMEAPVSLTLEVFTDCTWTLKIQYGDLSFSDCILPHQIVKGVWSMADADHMVLTVPTSENYSAGFEEFFARTEAELTPPAPDDESGESEYIDDDVVIHDDKTSIVLTLTRDGGVVKYNATVVGKVPFKNIAAPIPMKFNLDSGVIPSEGAPAEYTAIGEYMTLSGEAVKSDSTSVSGSIVCYNDNTWTLKVGGADAERGTWVIDGSKIVLTVARPDSPQTIDDPAPEPLPDGIVQDVIDIAADGADGYKFKTTFTYVKDGEELEFTLTAGAGQGIASLTLYATSYELNPLLGTGTGYSQGMYVYTNRFGVSFKIKFHMNAVIWTYVPNSSQYCDIYSDATVSDVIYNGSAPLQIVYDEWTDDSGYHRELNWNLLYNNKYDSFYRGELQTTVSCFDRGNGIVSESFHAPEELWLGALLGM